MDINTSEAAQVPRRPRLWLALLFPTPFCFFYLKDLKRFIVWTLIGLFLPAILSLAFWLLPRSSWGKIHLGFVVGLILTYYAILIIETIRSYFKETKSSLSIFYRPSAYWFFPLYIVAYLVVGDFVDPLKKIFMSAHNIPSPSSFPSIPIGDFLFVDNMINTSQLARGTLITFKAPDSVGDKTLLKRIIAIPGDTLEYSLVERKDCQCPNIEFKVNGIPLRVSPTSPPNHVDKREYSEQVRFFSETNGDHTYSVATDYGATAGLPLEEGGRPQKIQLAQDEYYVAGDFRPHSMDSRHFGPIKRSAIRGIYAYTYFSMAVAREFQHEAEAHPSMWVFKSFAKVRSNSAGRVSP